MSEFQERMAALQQLNLDIVAARKRGDHDQVKRLKAQVEVLLSGGAPPAPPAPTTPAKEEPTETPAPEPSEAPKAPAPIRTDPMAIMRELSVVNQQIVEARKAGKEEQVKRLQKRAEMLMAMGIG